MGERMYSSLVSLSHLLSPSRRLPNSRPATMVKPRFTIDVQTFTNLLLLVVPGGAVYFWTRGDQLDEGGDGGEDAQGAWALYCVLPR